jgi:hypothetical protein
MKLEKARDVPCPACGVPARKKCLGGNGDPKAYNEHGPRYKALKILREVNAVYPVAEVIVAPNEEYGPLLCDLIVRFEM